MKTRSLLAAGAAGTSIAFLGLALLLGEARGATRPQPGQEGKPVAEEILALKAEVARLKAVVPDQSHAMSDVAYHFTNLWFAVEKENWPLAQFYSDELRSHLKWAVRIIPKRKDAENREIDLVGILGGLETSTLKILDQCVKERDKPKFAKAYELQIEGCMACHRATNKPYIRLHVPERPDAGIVDFRPQ
jgi:hypothetical protein